MNKLPGQRKKPAAACPGFYTFAAMTTPAAFLFDMDGTLVDNMQYHLRAWERTVGEAGSPIKGAELKEQLYGKNSEVIERIFGEGKLSGEQIQEISNQKEKYYHEIYGSHIKLLPGLKDFLTEAHRLGVQMAIATAGIKENVRFILDHTDIRPLFSAFVSDDDVQESKPDPETFTKAAAELNVPPARCIVFEDSPKGIEAAGKASMKSVALLTAKGKETFASDPNVIKMVHDYTGLQVQDLLNALG